MPRRKKSDEGIMDITRMAEDLGVSKTTVSRALSASVWWTMPVRKIMSRT